MSKKQNDSNKVATLTNSYTKGQYAEFKKQHKQLIFRRRRLTVVFIISFAIFAVSGFHLMNDYQKLSDFETDKAAIALESSEMDKTVKRLEQDVALLKDEDYVAKVARSWYYVSKEGEQIYTVPELNSITSSSDTEEETDSSQTNQTQPQTSSENQ